MSRSEGAITHGLLELLPPSFLGGIVFLIVDKQDAISTAMAGEFRASLKECEGIFFITVNEGDNGNRWMNTAIFSGEFFGDIVAVETAVDTQLYIFEICHD
jgi:hypothetical protein